MKNKVKIIIKKIPFRLGDYILLPILRFLINNIKYLNKKARNLHHILNQKKLNKAKEERKDVFYAREVKKIQNSLEAGIENYIVVYDALISPPTYGDFMTIIMLARYINANDKKVIFYIIDSEENPEKFFQNSADVKSFICERTELLKILLNPNLSLIKNTSWREYLNEIKETKIKSYVVFENLVKYRMPIYHHGFNLVSSLLKQASNSVIKSTLLSKDNIFSEKLNLPESFKNGYITINCRYNENWRLKSNINGKEFYELGQYINKYKTVDNVVIVSSKEGCNYFKELSKSYEFDFIFSYDIAPGYINSLKLVLGSNYMIQFKGGGIGIVGIFSEIPYFFSCPVIHERIFNKIKIGSWSNQLQYFVNTNDYFLNTKLFKSFLRKMKNI